ncbi:NAD+ synthase [Alloscardovia macacae]|uniref:Glutamine-dependent NAD(+) synthetase n=1 Tax=Alloscardovia macacae TaxID=1160091 RepID=A0A261F5D3_9BIFI|nr:NAD+ synthase [Alloscardovia macacae]OZG54359.1 NAD+ synthetase [Alloscardovia macacae]
MSTSTQQNSKAAHLSFALAQMNTNVGAIEQNKQTILSFARRAHDRGARVVVFPEMTLSGYPIEDLAFRATFRTAAEQAAEDIARSLQEEGCGDLFVVLGTVGTAHMERVEEGGAHDDRPTNTLLVLHEGQILHTYDKQFLPNYGVFDEFRIFTPGHDTLTMEVDGYRLGFAICEDIWQDDGPAAQLASADLDVLVTINGSPFEEGKESVREQLCQRRASEVGAPVIYVNQVGGQDDLVFDGSSFVVDASGEVVARLKAFEEDLRVWTLGADGATVGATVRSSADGSDGSDGAFVLASDPLAPVLDADEKVYTACVLGLKDYMRKNGFKGVVLGLSGGIDSALVAAMAADAVGGENVWGVSMPSMYSSDGSKDDASDLAERLGAHYDIQPIEPLFAAFQNQLALTGVAEENLQARMRGVIVMAYSNAHGLLAVATGNKSELACGYSTIYGDAVGGYAPIKDLLKTRVWQLARWRNARAGLGGELLGRPVSSVPPIPENSITKAPSAELRPGQKDSDSLPEYALLDAVLEAYIEKAHGRADLLADGFDEATVDTVMRLVDRAEWKRRQYPLGPKVTALAFGRDRRLPVTNAFRE